MQCKVSGYLHFIINKLIAQGFLSLTKLAALLPLFIWFYNQIKSGSSERNYLIQYMQIFPYHAAELGCSNV